jgi:hypothetical protein
LSSSPIRPASGLIGDESQRLCWRHSRAGGNLCFNAQTPRSPDGDA